MRDIKIQPLRKIIFIATIFLLTILKIQCKINNNMFEPQILLNKQLPITRLQAAGHWFSIPSTDATYELSGDVYQSSSVSGDDQIYNISNYNKSQSCTYFRSIVEMGSLQAQDLNYMALQSMVSQQKKQVYVIGVKDQFQDNKKFVKIYSYNNNNFAFQSEIPFTGTNLSQDTEMDIFMVNIDNSTLFSDGNSLYKLQSRSNHSNFYWIKIEGWDSGMNQLDGEEFLGLQSVVFQGKQLLLCLYSQKIVFYQFQKMRVSKQLEIKNTGQDSFEDVQIGSNNSRIFVVAGNQLLTYSEPEYKTAVQHQLAGQSCTKIYIYYSTIHIICEFQKRNFIGQYFYNDTSSTLILNRFYNDLQNYRLLQYIDNYFLMIGEDDIILTSNGVNRKVLLDMPKNAYSEKFVSFGIQNIFLLDNVQKPDYTQTLFAVGEDYLVMFKMTFLPAEAWCYIDRPLQSLQKNILIVRNTSQCEMNEKSETLKSICVNLMPVQLSFQHYELQSRTTTLAVVLIILLVCVLALLCLGCVFKQNMTYNNMVNEIKKKIKNFKPRANHQIRDI